MRDLFYLGLSNAVVVVFLALPAYCVSRWGKRPALAHVLWLLVLIKLVTPPLWQVPLALPSLSPPEAAKTPAVAGPIPELMPVGASMAAIPTGPELPASDEQSLNGVPNLEIVRSASPPVSVPPQVTNLSAATPRAPFEIPWQETLGFCWLAGSLVVFGLTLWRMVAFIRCLRRVQPALGNMQELAGELSRQLGLRRAPHLGIARIRMAPLVWGLGTKPRVIIPAELWRSLDPEQRAMLLVHELAHLRRGDHWVRWLEILVRGIYWWHPVVWLAGREMREAEEQCCDAWAIWALPHAAKAYARAIVDTVDFLAQRSVPLPVGASGIGQVQDLRRRLIMIMRGTTPRKLSATALAGLIVLGGSMILLGPTFGQQRSTTESASTDDPFQATTPAVRTRVSEADQNPQDELTRLRKQEQELQIQLERLNRRLNQTRNQLKSIQVAPPQEIPAAAAAVPGREVPGTPSPNYRQPTDPRATQPGERPNAARVFEEQARPRFTRDRPVEERLTWLEEQMSQIADDLHALRSNAVTPDAPRRVYPPAAPQPTLDPRNYQRPAPRPLAPPAVEPPVPPEVDDPIQPLPAATIPPPAALPARPRRPPGDVSPVPTTPSPSPARPAAPVSPSAVPVVPRPPLQDPDSDPLASPVPSRQPETPTSVTAPSPKPDSVNSRTFSIPIALSEDQKGKIRELELFVSSDEGRTFTRASVIPPEKSGFTYTAPADGMYWFKVATVDLKGNRDPEDIYKATRVSKILVDTHQLIR